MLFLAMSCFQARLQDAAWRALVALEPDGVQLTPGNLPVSGFREQVAAAPLAIRLHHGFAWDVYRAPVWTKDGAPLFTELDRSVHPPAKVADLDPWLDAMANRGVVLETMVPGLPLGTGDELTRAMDRGVGLAVDVSHLHIQETSGALSPAVRERLYAYDRVVEIHVSQNDGRADLHHPISAVTPGLGWARSRTDLPVILESRFHRATFDEQRRQVDLLRD